MAVLHEHGEKEKTKYSVKVYVSAANVSKESASQEADGNTAETGLSKNSVSLINIENEGSERNAPIVKKDSDFQQNEDTE